MQKPRSLVVASVAIVSVLLPLVGYVPPSVAAVSHTARTGGSGSLTRARLATPTLAPNVVTVSASTLAANLVGASSDGSTYVFKSSTGALGQLAPGKVMLLQGYAVAVVVSVSHSGSRLTVITRPAALTDIFKTADVNFSEPIDFADTFGTLRPGRRLRWPPARREPLRRKWLWCRLENLLSRMSGFRTWGRERTTSHTASR